jgi:hypothetical protein
MAQWVESKEDLFTVLLHEMFHPAWHHFVAGRNGGEIENIGCDAIINSSITHLFGKKTRNGDFFKRFYESEPLIGILRPDAHEAMKGTKYEALYNSLYPPQYSSNPPAKMSSGQIIQALKRLMPPQKRYGITLIGSGHSRMGEDATAPEIPSKVLSKIAKDIERAARSGVQAGYSMDTFKFFFQVIRRAQSIRTKLLSNYTIKQRLDRFFETSEDYARQTSPVPIDPTRREILMVMADYWPGVFNNRVQNDEVKEAAYGIALYLDVSGSVMNTLPELVGMLYKHRRRIRTVFCFSNRVIETDFSDLVNGDVQTTYGTDFNCIARSILENGFEKAVIITDGYASLNKALETQLRSMNLQTLTILFGGANSNNPFKAFGEIMELEEAIEVA